MKILYPIEEHNYKFEEILKFASNVDDLKKRRIIQESDNGYKFKYVGIIVNNDENNTNIIIVLPKYLKGIVLTHAEKKEYAKLLMQVFRQYTKESLKKENLNSLDYLSSNTQFDQLAIIDYLIEDYIENGLYSNNIEMHEYNGDGLIDWNKTIQEEYALISHGQVIYPDVHTRIDEDDEENYIRHLHQYILYESFAFLEKLSFLDLFEYPSLYMHQPRLDLKDVSFQIRAIDIEMRNIFSDRKINLLKAMKYLLKKESSLFENKLILYGTTSFHTIWEKAVSNIFINQFEEFKKDIPYPEWKHRNTGKPSPANGTLTPDTIRHIDNDIFVVDAKYYHVPFGIDGSLIDGYPGVSDVSKQYLYIKALKSKPKLSSYQYYNSFVIPSSRNYIENTGEVDFSIFPEFPKIQVILFPAKKVFEMYIENRVLSNADIISNFRKGNEDCLSHLVIEYKNSKSNLLNTLKQHDIAPETINNIVHTELLKDIKKIHGNITQEFKINDILNDEYCKPLKDFLARYEHKLEPDCVDFIKSSASTMFYFNAYLDKKEDNLDYTLPASAIWKAIEVELNASITHLIRYELGVSDNKLYKEKLTSCFGHRGINTGSLQPMNLTIIDKRTDTLENVMLGSFEYILKQVKQGKNKNNTNDLFCIFGKISGNYDLATKAANFIKNTVKTRNIHTHQKNMSKEEFNEQVVKQIFVDSNDVFDFYKIMELKKEIKRYMTVDRFFSQHKDTINKFQLFGSVNNFVLIIPKTKS